MLIWAVKKEFAKPLTGFQQNKNDFQHSLKNCQWKLGSDYGHHNLCMNNLNEVLLTFLVSGQPWLKYKCLKLYSDLTVVNMILRAVSISIYYTLS